MIKFIHSSDLHLGKPFGRFDEDLRVRLREARFQKIPRIAREARSVGVSLVLLAGDTFDAETPPPSLLRQAIRAFAHESDITWVILPGNHDSLEASELWSRFESECPGNVILALQEEVVIEIGSDIAILPAPPPVRHPGRDLTGWMDGAVTPSERVRIGLAHGPIHGFSEDNAPLGLIAPNRADLARLDYLALGDWHGRIEVSKACHYSGAPESDSFKDHPPACVLLVELDGPGAQPRVTQIDTGDIAWHGINADFRPGDDPAERLDSLLPPPVARRDALVQLVARGRMSLSEHARLEQVIQDIEHDFGSFEARLDQIVLEHEDADLDEIDATSGALRQAAEALLAASGNSDADVESRRVSRAALSRLYGYALEVRK